MAFFSRVKIFSIILVFCLAITIPFFNSFASAESSMMVLDGNAVFWSETDELIKILLPNNVVEGYVRGNAYQSGTSGANNASFIFGLIPYSVSFSGVTDVLSKELLESASFTWFLTLPMAVRGADGSIGYDLNDLDSYDTVFFSATQFDGRNYDGVTLDAYTGNTYFCFRVTTGSYTQSDSFSYSGVYENNYYYIAQTLYWLRSNAPDYFNGGANIKSMQYQWNVALEYLTPEQELQNSSNQALEDSINNTITQGNQQVTDSIDNMTNLGSGNFDDMSSDLSDINSSIDNSEDIIGSVEKPDISTTDNQISNHIDIVISNPDVSDEIQSFFNLFFANTFIIGLILVSVSVGVVKYVFFGKG